MKTINTMLKNLADAVDIRRVTDHASRAANTACRTTAMPDTAMWETRRTTNTAAYKAQTALDDILASVRAYLATQ